MVVLGALLGVPAGVQGDVTDALGLLVVVVPVVPVDEVLPAWLLPVPTCEPAVVDGRQFVVAPVVPTGLLG